MKFKLLGSTFLACALLALPATAHEAHQGYGMMQGQGSGMMQGQGRMAQDSDGTGKAMQSPYHRGGQMGPGMMGGQYGPGMMGGHMGPGMMGGHMGPGMMGGHMGPGMMGGHMGPGMMMGRANMGHGPRIGPFVGGPVPVPRAIKAEDVQAGLENILRRIGNDNLSLGEVAETEDGNFRASIVTDEGSTVQTLEVDGATGVMWQVD